MTKKLKLIAYKWEEHFRNRIFGQLKEYLDELSDLHKTELQKIG